MKLNMVSNQAANIAPRVTSPQPVKLQVQGAQETRPITLQMQSSQNAGQSNSMTLQLQGPSVRSPVAQKGLTLQMQGTNSQGGLTLQMQGNNTQGTNSQGTNSQGNNSQGGITLQLQGGGLSFPTAESYMQYDQRTHVYEKPDMYIGGDERMSREEWLYDIANKKMYNAVIDFVPGCERLYLEILTNASDNSGRSRRAKVDPGRIDIVMTNKVVDITNYGLPIPIEIHKEKGIYVPQMIFGSMLTSSNYKVDRHEAGTNGIGAKAVNIFSVEFVVIIHDHIRHLKYTQIWTNNMINCGEPVIEEYTGKISSVQTIYTMDFQRFRYPIPNGTEGGYPPEAFALFARHAIDISFTAKIPVSFNGNEFNCANIRDYARLYFGDTVDTAIVHYQWPAGTEVVRKKKGYQISKDPAITPEIELIAIDTPDDGHHVSFVNCMMTREGGVHVNAAIKAVGENAVSMINEETLKRLTKQNKGKELDAKEKRAHTITIADVKPHISILLAAKVVNPKFTSQTKTSLHSPTPKIDISEDELKAMQRWQLIDRLHAALEAKQFASLSKTDGKLRRYVRLLKGIDANNAGKADRHNCVLYITEGRSGAGYANKLVGLVPGGRDNIGVLPMRGKSLNVMKADRFQIERNAEINELKKMLGLVECPDTKLKDTYYLEPNNFSRLRYGAIMIMADSDVDGKHIIGLILNFFYCRFPSLLARGYVMYYRTPILRVTFNRKTLKFYTDQEYQTWRKNNEANLKSWKHKYYKGLGTSKDAEIKDDFMTPRVVKCFYDVDTPAAMRLAFNKDFADQRKAWIGNWRHVLGVDNVQMQPISWFINHELIQFSIADTQRSIPKLMDGLKESHRKIIYGAHHKYKIGSRNKQYNECKVAQFGAFVAEHSNYHHGELILDDVIVGMAQDFVGANNISWFTQDGQFGCVDPDTPILLWDGSIKPARDVSITDGLVGDDGIRRQISRIVHGTDAMYEVVQEYGAPYRVNSQHILTVRFPDHKLIQQHDDIWMLEYFDPETNQIRSYTGSLGQVETFALTIPDNDIFDINLQTYLTLDQERFTSVSNHTPVQWDKQTVPLDPYTVGFNLGSKPIPAIYMYNDTETRLRLLAGVIDATGNDTSTGYELTNAGSDLEYIARSLGFKTVRLEHTLLIEGNGIPVKVNTVKTNCKIIGGKISINPVGRGEYVGWYIDGNERFLLGDFTVTHNTRYQGGKDAAETRYSYTRPERLVPYILREEDQPILKHITDDGDVVEPESYYPIIPMILVNGAYGIGTGYSTFIPNHNPLDLIRWLRLKLSGISEDDLFFILPWYRGFNGTIKIIDRRKKKRNNSRIQLTIINNEKVETMEAEDEPVDPPSTEALETEISDNEDEEELDPAMDDTKPLFSVVTLGEFHRDLNGTIIITELPVGRWPHTYHKWLESLVEEKKITGFRDCSVSDTVYFEIYGFTGAPTYRGLKLQRTMGMSNMVALDQDSRPICYDTSFDIMESFYYRRLPIYEERKAYQLKHLSDEIITLNHKIRFIQAVISKEIRVVNRSIDEIREGMARIQVPFQIYEKSKIRNLSEDDITKLRETIAAKEAERREIEQISPAQMWLRELDELEQEYNRVYPTSAKNKKITPGITLSVTQ